MQHGAKGSKIPFVLEEEGLDASLRPIFHGIGEHLHRHLVSAEIVAHK